jgi:hypothetical protein
MSPDMERSMDFDRANFWVGTWDGGWLVLPLVAVFCGAWAFTDLSAPGTLAFAAVLVLAGWAPLWRAVVTTDWATPLAHWRTWETVAPLPIWPYLQPGTPGAVLYGALGRARSWWHACGAEFLAIPLRSACFALIISLLLGMGIGRSALLLTLLFLTLTELAALWHEGRGTGGKGWEALALVGLPWLLGASLGGTVLLPLLSAVVVTALVAGYARPGWLAMAGALIAALFLLWQQQPFAAGVLLLLVFPGLWLSANRVAVLAYRRAVLPWIVAMLLLFAGVL